MLVLYGSLLVTCLCLSSRASPCRQREHLEKTISDLRAQLKHGAATNSKRTAVAVQASSTCKC